MSLCTIPNNCYGHHKCCIYVCWWNECENVHCSFNLIFLDLICEKTKNNTLLIYLNISNFCICFSKPLDLSLTKLKYTLWTKFKVKVKVKRSTL